ncbi:MAG TPA: hypothetical protein VFM65_00350 [Flavobacteriaceae bacterium]|nr:hypothetical protein [Flavobacteriaceae bacterium]
MERFENIEKLVEKYLEGTTSLEEEKTLKAYFSSENVAPHLKEYAVLFGFFQSEREQVYHPQKEPVFKKAKRYTWFAVAASIAIIAGVFLFKPAPQPELGTIEDPEVALQKTKEVLHLIAQQLHTGKEGLVYLTEIDNTRDELIENNLK